jgi:thiol-disulfide isomerase/thioredoxin
VNINISRSKVFLLIGIAILAIAFFLVSPAAWASANEVSNRLAITTTETPTPTPDEGLCKVNAATPCAPTEGNSNQQMASANVSGNGVVNAVLFWMQGCPHCETVMNSVLPPLQQKYGDKLNIQFVELNGAQDVDRLYQLGSRLGIVKDDIGVPFLILGDHSLVGDQAIESELSGAIDKELAQGGVSSPTIPEFNLAAARVAGPIKAQNKAVIYMFWGDGCPHCAAAKPILQGMDQASEQVELNMYEVWYIEENQALFKKMAAAYEFEPQGVPTIFIGKQHWEGWNDQIKIEVQAAVDACLESGCPNAGVGIIPGVVETANVPQPSQTDPAQTTGKRIDIPLIGTVDLSSQSLLVSTLLISFVDGVNPCSIWVLTMLLALTLHTGSRKKVLMIGLIFLTVTAGVYALFIAGLFTMFKVVSFVGWIQAAVAVVALFFALVNIKDYFWYKEGISFTIADDKKPGIFQRIRRIMDASQSFWGLVGGTIVLAGGVSLVEFSCTAGFPVLWTNLLVAQNVSALTFVLLLLVYLAIYQLDEMGIFFFAVFTMRASKLEEKQGRILKLVGGMLMLALAGVMLVNPSLMNNLTSSLIVFGGAFGATLLILLVHRTILPKFGIHIGTELGGKTTRKQRKLKKGTDHAG